MTATVAPASPNVLEFDPTTFASQYNRVPFGFRHRLYHHPLLSVPALLALAKRIPATVTQHRANITIEDDFYNAHKKHPVNESVEVTMNNLETVARYVQITHPEVDPEYAEFLGPLWDEIGALVDPIDPGRCERGSFIFISSPKAVTPFHLDRVANFHLQIQGNKDIQLWDPMDRSIVSDEDLAHCVAAPRSFHAPYRPEFEAKAMLFEQKPGLGVHHPWGAPHAVRVGDDVSVSIAITFRSAEMHRRMDLYNVNHQLRKRVRINPAPIGHSAIRDAIKWRGYRVYTAVKTALTGRKLQYQ